MKAAAFLKAPTELVKSNPDFLNYLLSKEVKRLSLREKKKACKPFYISFYQEGFDFVKDITTVKYEFELYKAHRFVK